MSAVKQLLESLYFEVIPMKGFEEKLDVLKAGDRVGHCHVAERSARILLKLNRPRNGGASRRPQYLRHRVVLLSTDHGQSERQAN